MKVLLCIPTLNPGDQLVPLVESILSQTLQPTEVLVVDSSSSDGSAEEFRRRGIAVHEIPRSQFNHGATRQLCVDMHPDKDVVVFMTQDAILAAPNSIERLVAAFEDEQVGAAYGRQLPHRDAGPIGAHARLFNYPEASCVRSGTDRGAFGIKTVFVSNSFAAYRRAALVAVGGFPNRTILGEDTYVVAKMLIGEWKIAYCADAVVFHSHDYGFMEEFSRYFDTGVFHAREPWIREFFGGAGGEGLKYIRSEMNYLFRKDPALLGSAFVRTIFKYVGFQLGLREKVIPMKMKRRFSMHRRFWDGEVRELD